MGRSPSAQDKEISHSQHEEFLENACQVCDCLEEDNGTNHRIVAVYLWGLITGCKNSFTWHNFLFMPHSFSFLCTSTLINTDNYISYIQFTRDHDTKI